MPKQPVARSPVPKQQLPSSSTFFADRLKVHLREQGVRHDLIAAVFAGGAEDDLVRLLVPGRRAKRLSRHG